MKFYFVSILIILLTIPLWGQNKKQLEHSDYEVWNHITDKTISPDGKWVGYTLGQENRDGECHIVSGDKKQEYVVVRGDSVRFFPDAPFACLRIHVKHDSMRQAKLKIKKKEKLPKDTLAVLRLSDGKLKKLGPVLSQKLPSDKGAIVAFLTPMPKSEPDSTTKKKPAKIKGKRLFIYYAQSGDSVTFDYVTTFSMSSDGSSLAFVQNKADSTQNGVRLFRVKTHRIKTLASGAGKYTTPVFDKKAAQVAFIHTKKDTATLFLKTEKSKDATPVLSFGDSRLPENFQPGALGKMRFSDSGKRLFFGISPFMPQPPKDSIPDDEKVKVDIWNWKDALLQPQQLKQVQKEKKRTWMCVWFTRKNKFVQLATKTLPEIRLTRDGDSDYAMGLSDLPYRKEISWDYPFYQDVYSVHISDGNANRILTRVQDTPRLSPDGSSIAWWDRDVFQWKAASLKNGTIRSLSKDCPVSLKYDLHDWPYKPDSYGAAGWTIDGKSFIVYGKYDLWALDFKGRKKPVNLTSGFGARKNLRLRRLKTDPEEKGINLKQPQLLYGFQYTDKSSGYFRLVNKNVSQLAYGAWRYSFRPLKAKKAAKLLYSRENFHIFPDLHLATTELKNDLQISDANPQQKDYLWGDVELVHWISADGIPLDGLLYTPENFDPHKKYPMMVYFYERNSHNLHRYWAPQPLRSIINFTFYTSRGYLVFVPDIPYEVGYPGPSAMKAVLPGVTSLIEKGFVDEQHIGVQGHSWGGYQIAYLVTQTHLFAAAEAGAPVSNMFSAYGGIRWGSGMSRMFQYEKTQSRIGGSLWERPLQYLENSPIFWVDKITTPVLIMHNDHDGAVPWYQGIEFFVAMRRLNKPAWMISYNNQPHWPVTYANKRDWAIRMQQFFDYFLKGAPAPVWISKGVPAIKKGKTLGYELEK